MHSIDVLHLFSYINTYATIVPEFMMLLIILQYEESLTGGSFDEGNMVKNIEACDWLTSAIKNLEASNIDPIYVKLRAVGSLSSYK